MDWQECFLGLGIIPYSAELQGLPNWFFLQLCLQVDMSEEEDELQSVITQCLTVLLLGIETKLEGALAAMARMNWGGMEMVGDGVTGFCGMGAGWGCVASPSWQRDQCIGHL